MEHIKKYLSENFYQLCKYCLTSVVSIGFLFGFNYFLTDLLKFDPRVGYFISITTTYAFIYLASSGFIFEKKMSVRTAKSFLVYVLVFWSLNNIFFNLIYHFFNINYLVITAINIVLFFPLRFFSQKHLVFKD